MFALQMEIASDNNGEISLSFETELGMASLFI